MKPNKAFAESFLDKYPFAQIIGDCDKPGKSGEAVRAGFMAAYSIE